MCLPSCLLKNLFIAPFTHALYYSRLTIGTPVSSSVRYVLLSFRGEYPPRVGRAQTVRGMNGRIKSGIDGGVGCISHELFCFFVFL